MHASAWCAARFSAGGPSDTAQATVLRVEEGSWNRFAVCRLPQLAQLALRSEPLEYRTRCCFHQSRDACRVRMSAIRSDALPSHSGGGPIDLRLPLSAA